MRKRWIIDDFVVGDPETSIRRRSWAILDANGDGDYENCADKVNPLAARVTRRNLLEETIQTSPAQASHLMRPRVWMLPKKKPTAAAMATNTAVQVPWVETALSEIEIASIPEPATKIQPIPDQ